MTDYSLKPNPMRQHDPAQDERVLSERMQRAAFVTHMAELDLFEQVLNKEPEASKVAQAMDGLTLDEQVRLIDTRVAIRHGQPLTDADRALLDKASHVTEQASKKLSRRMLRSVKDSNVQLLTIMAHSPIYPHQDRMKALKQLDDMRAGDPAMTQDEVNDIIRMPLAKAYEKLAELTLLGSITKEQAAQTIRALDARNEAEIRDLKNKFLPQGAPPLPAGALAMIQGGRHGAA